MPDPEALRKAAAAVDPTEFWIPDDDVIGAWLNAKLLGVDPVFPNKSIFSLASSLYFEGEEGRRTSRATWYRSTSCRSATTRRSA
jgi:hypothetical protein